jgi:ABC-2 type transport system permease protein
VTVTPRTAQRAAPSLAPPGHGSCLRALAARGVRDHAAPAAAWGAAIGALCALVVALWPSVRDALPRVTGSYPPAVRRIFDVGRLDTVQAYLHTEMFSLIVPLAVALFVVRRVVATLDVAEERAHLDTLLAAPVARSVLVGAAVAAGLVGAAALLAVVAAVTLAASAIAGAGLAVDALVAGIAGVWALGALAAGLAALACGLVRHPGIATAGAVGVLGAMYVVEVTGRLTDALGPVRDLSAFRLYGAQLRDGLDPGACLALTAAGAILAAAGAAAFQRRDIQ